MYKSKLLNNESGIILLTVIMLTIVLSIVAISIMSIHLSHRQSSKSVVESIQAEQLALGAFMEYQQIRNEGCQGPPDGPCEIAGDCTTCDMPGNETLDNKFFEIIIDDSDSGGGPNETDKILIDVSY